MTPDDIGYGDIASLGNPVVQTPNLCLILRNESNNLESVVEQLDANISVLT